VVDAYKRGYREALNHDSDWILELDAGYSHLPSDIPVFFNKMMEGNYDCVFGSRFSVGSKFMNASMRKYLLSRGGTLLTNLLLGTKLKDMTGGFELFRKEALGLILGKGVFSEGPFFQTVIKAYAHGFNIAEVPITYDASTSHARRGALTDAFTNLYKLFQLRRKHNLFIIKRNSDE
jgi:dolichol-phosphate mannosyltransferase